jgi:hypothetical protein
MEFIQIDKGVGQCVDSGRVGYQKPQIMEVSKKDWENAQRIRCDIQFLKVLAHREDRRKGTEEVGGNVKAKEGCGYQGKGVLEELGDCVWGGR